MLPSADTIVTYPDGDTTSTSTVLHTETLADGRVAVLLDRTAFHPVDHTWPDQGADRGTLDGQPVLDAIVGATDGTQLHIGRDIPVRKGEAGWAFVVVHMVAKPVQGEVEVVVDADYREALSTGHTACHLASLALNHALAGAWSKEVALDAAGSPNFDALAIETSTIVPDGSVDVYRIGKSLRKKGFVPSALDGEIEAAANTRLAELLATHAAVGIEREGLGLADRRFWVCGDYRIPCGGTHRSSVDDLGALQIQLKRTEADGAIELVMTTSRQR
jgi:alanyl-tRNA synthetase